MYMKVQAKNSLGIILKSPLNFPEREIELSDPANVLLYHFIKINRLLWDLSLNVKR